MKRIFTVVLLFIAIFTITACGSSEVAENNETNETTTEKSTRKPNSVVGKWYEIVGDDYIEIWEFTENGKLKKDNEKSFYNENVIRTYDEYKVESDMLTITYKDIEDTYKIEYTDYGFAITNVNNSNYRYELYENREEGIVSHPNYKTFKVYYKTIADEDGFVIEDGELIKYVGDETEVKIPEEVRVIQMGAFMCEEDSVSKIIIPGTVKEIEEYAINEIGGVGEVYIEEGVEKIGERAIFDTYIDVIYIPESVKEIGRGFLEDSEGVNEVEIHVKEGSYAEEYFKGEGENVVQKLVIE